MLSPGIYSNYCVEVAVENLAVNTVALAEELGQEDKETAGARGQGERAGQVWTRWGRFARPSSTYARWFASGSASSGGRVLLFQRTAAQLPSMVDLAVGPPLQPSSPAWQTDS